MHHIRQGKHGARSPASYCNRTFKGAAGRGRPAAQGGTFGRHSQASKAGLAQGA
jgi:hypothetical protein